MKVGLIGYGYWGGGFVARNIARVADLAVIVDPDPIKLTHASEAWAAWGVRVASEPRVAFDECDAIWIATPVDTHADLAGDALRSGCHVMCEKPFVLSEVDAAVLSERAEAEDLALMTGHLSLFTGAHRGAKVAVSTSVGQGHRVSMVRQTDRPSISDKNVAWGLGPHDVAACLDLFGEAPAEVEWRGNTHRMEGVLKFTHSWASLTLDWLGATRHRHYVVDGQDYVDLPNQGEPLFQEVSAFLDLCENGDREERAYQRWLSHEVVKVIEQAEVPSWM